jgi:hypothetical protein
MESKIRERVKLHDLGLYLRTIELDYNPKNNQERADLITQFFNVICLKEDVDNYELHYHNHDWELESRREEYFNKLERHNPFY